MRTERHKSKLTLERTLLIVGVLASLCFSAGEGIRLLPFDAASAGEAGGSDHINVQCVANTQCTYTEANCGAARLKLPSAAQKQVKSRSADPSLPFSISTQIPLPRSTEPPYARDPYSCALPIIVSQSAGRAPPLTS